MGDLTDDELIGLSNSFSLHARRAAVEIMRRRAAQAASAERVREVVREVFATVSERSGAEFAQRHIEDIATRVASQLAAPAPLMNDNDHATLAWLRQLLGSIAYRVAPERVAAIAMIDRLLAGAR
jgi:hypothetical protein